MKRSSYKAVILLLCAAIFMSFSLLAIHPHSDSCHSSGCTLCTLSEFCRNIVRAVVVATFTFGMPQLVLSCIKCRQSDGVSTLTTLIDLKVKLSN